MNQIGILALVAAAATEPDLPLLLVNQVDVAHHEFAARNLVLRLPGGDIDQVEVSPAVLLGEVDNLAGLLEPTHSRHAEVLGMFGPDKRFRYFIDDVARVAGEGVDFDDAESLMAAVDFFIAEVSPIGGPAQVRPAKIDESNLRFLMGSLCHVEPVQFMDGELVAGQGIFAGVKLGPPPFAR